LGDEGISFRNQYRRQHSPGAFTCDFSQGIVDRFRLRNRMTLLSLDMAYRSFSGGSG
jgi:hypothetical protein